MKLQKKLFILAVLLMAASMVFAQTSMTSHSTQELFGTDVDDFMNVNEWQNVKPKNIFGYLGYNTPEIPGPPPTPPVLGSGYLNFGLAHQFKPFYLGTYFEGRFNSLYHNKKDNGDTNTNLIDLSTNPPTTPPTTTYKTQGKLLFGFGNIGVMTDISYQPDKNKSVAWTKSTKTKTTKDIFDLDFNLMAGINLNSNNKLYKISAKLGLDSKVNKETKEVDGKVTKFDDYSTYTLNINAGFSHDFSSKDSLTQTVAADLETKWNIYPTKTKIDQTTGDTTYTYGKLHDVITLTPKYQIAYEPEGKFAFKAEAGLKTEFDFNNEYNYKHTFPKSGSDSKTYNNSRDYNTTFNINPSLKAAFVYAPVSKFKLNFGLGFNVPSVTWAFTTKETRDVSSGKVSKTDKSNTFIFTTADGKFKASSGFTWLITENLTLDANWDIIQNLLNNTFQTQLTEGSGTSILNTINKLVVHNVKFAVSVKF